MRSGGFPCRYQGCGVTFAVADQNSMDALFSASARRSEHEVAQHGFTHVRLDEQVVRPTPYSRVKKEPRVSS